MLNKKPTMNEFIESLVKLVVNKNDVKELAEGITKDITEKFGVDTPRQAFDAGKADPQFMPNLFKEVARLSIERTINDIIKKYEPNGNIENLSVEDQAKLKDEIKNTLSNFLSDIKDEDEKDKVVDTLLKTVITALRQTGGQNIGGQQPGQSQAGGPLQPTPSQPRSRAKIAFKPSQTPKPQEEELDDDLGTKLGGLGVPAPTPGDRFVHVGNVEARGTNVTLIEWINDVILRGQQKVFAEAQEEAKKAAFPSPYLGR